MSEAAQILKDRLGSHYEELTLKRLVTGLFFTGVELS
ncbi:MAG TPA: Fis family transcriptional regulator, partial [Deltaproteobacteria bacterium]|nr:Fis family transcriptional regulator [Deltaproteobacteria bacterium]